MLVGSWRGAICAVLTGTKGLALAQNSIEDMSRGGQAHTQLRAFSFRCEGKDVYGEYSVCLRLTYLPTVLDSYLLFCAVLNKLHGRGLGFQMAVLGRCPLAEVSFRVVLYLGPRGREQVT